MTSNDFIRFSLDYPLKIKLSSLSINILEVQSVQSLSCGLSGPHGLQYARPPRPSPSPPAFNLSQHQGLFQ